MKIRDLVPWRGSKSKIPVTRSENPFYSLQREMNRMFDDFFSGFELEPFWSSRKRGGMFAPSIDVEDTGKAIKVRVELPGMEEKDLDLSLTADSLTIRGEKKSSKERTESGACYYESSYGRFERVIPLSTEIDPDRVEASLKKGVLTVSLPKAHPEKHEVRRISVNAD